MAECCCAGSSKSCPGNMSCCQPVCNTCPPPPSCVSTCGPPCGGPPCGPNLVPCGPEFGLQNCLDQCLSPNQPFPPIASRLPCNCPNVSNMTPGIPWLQGKAVADPACANVADNCVPIDACRIKYTCRLPERAKSFKPIAKYKPPLAPFEPETVYNQSYLPCKDATRKPIVKSDNLCLGVGKFEDYTVHKLSYIPFCQMPECFITPFPGCVELIQDEDEDEIIKKKKKRRRRAKKQAPVQCQCLPECQAECQTCCEPPQNNVFNCFNKYAPWYSIIRPCV